MMLTSKQEELVTKNMGLVYHFANQMGVSPNDIDYDDIASIGKFGLIKAASTYDESKKTKFSTYASKCIKNEIYMHFRREKRHKYDISLEEPIHIDNNGNVVTLGEAIPSYDVILEEEYEAFIKLISVVLNCLSRRNRMIMLYKISGYNQKRISKMLNLSRSYVSRLESSIAKKVRLYLTSQQQYEEVFQMSVSGDSYRISFASENVKEFNKIFATLLQNLTSAEDLPNFKVHCNKERIIIQIPAHPESFSFIAQIIQEIDEFSMSFVSEKNDIPEGSDSTEEEKKKATHDTKTTEPEEDDDESAVDKNGYGSVKKRIREYILSKESFTIKEIKEDLSDLKPGSITFYLNSDMKKEGLITSVGRGKYVVNKS